MMDYLIGDLQGCCDPLDQLLATIDFSPSRDRIHLLGDLVNRGPQSLPVLRRLAGLGDAAQCLLGNHDLHLLAVAHGVRKPGKGDTLDAILADPQRDALLDWLRHRRLAAQGLRLADGARRRHPAVVGRAGARACAAEIEALLRSPDIATFLPGDVRQRAAPLGRLPCKAPTAGASSSTRSPACACAVPMASSNSRRTAPAKRPTACAPGSSTPTA